MSTPFDVKEVGGRSTASTLRVTQAGRLLRPRRRHELL